ncbi:MAG: PqqD family protein [Kiritimatiellia bacterium]
MNPDTTIPVKSDNSVFRIVDGEAVVVDVSGGMVSVINRVGTRIWELVDGSRTVREIAGLIAAEYNIAVQTALEDTLGFLQELSRNELAVLRPAAHGGPGRKNEKKTNAAAPGSLPEGS